MQNENLLAIARLLLSTPTAPFHEAGMRAVIARRLAEKCPHVETRQDAFGNLIARYRHGGDETQNSLPPPARWAFAAHMDHPAWVRPASDNPDAGKTADGWTFLGGVPEATLRANAHRIETFGDFAMWALPDLEIAEEGGTERLFSRACDDLIGCAAILGMFEELEATGAACDCYGLFTRAEEVGFVGAIQMARDGWLQEAGVTVISLETSAERPPARQGSGPIVRVGDKTSIFDPAATAELTTVATESGIPFQRCLMPGGTCEATAFQLYGIRSAALCVALGNYHNCAPESRIAAEFVSTTDYFGLAQLCFQIARRAAPAATADPVVALRQKLESSAANYRPYFGRAVCEEEHGPA